MWGGGDLVEAIGAHCLSRCYQRLCIICRFTVDSLIFPSFMPDCIDGMDGAANTSAELDLLNFLIGLL